MTAITPCLHEINITVPASIANLGPGFDTLAVAVQLYLRIKATPVAGRGRLQFDFVDHEIAGDNRIERAYRYLAGDQADDLPSMAVEVRTEIPMCAGLGSSAAATVAGLFLYGAVAGPIPLTTMLEAACALEGHPDNAAAALLGGLTASCRLSDGTLRAVRFSWPESLQLLVVTPKCPLSTKESRAVLPLCLPLDQTVYNLQRIALLLHAVQSRDFSLLKHALADEVHQSARAEIVPGLKEALQLQHPDLLGICLCGSGPSIVALVERNLAAVSSLLSSTYDRLRIPHAIRALRAHHESLQLIGSGAWHASPQDEELGENCGVLRLG